MGLLLSAITAQSSFLANGVVFGGKVTPMARPFLSFHASTIPSLRSGQLSFTARIERAQLHRARSASKKDGLAAPFF